MNITHKDYWDRVTDIDACSAALVAYEGDDAVSALARQRLAELSLSRPQETPQSRLINHINKTHPQTATQILADLLADTGSQDTVNLIKAKFWEMRPHDAPPAKGTDWTNENIADPKYVQLLSQAISFCKLRRRLPPATPAAIALKNYFEGRSPLSRDDILRHLHTLTGQEDLVGRIRGSFWEKGGRQSLPGGADWVDVNLANPDCRHTLGDAILDVAPDVFTQITEEERVPSPAPAGAGGGGAGAAAGVVAFSPPAPGRGTRLAAVGMVNEGGTDCYLVTAWQLLLNIPRLRNQILKHLLPCYRQDGLNVDLTRLTPLAGEHLRAKAAGTTTPLKGSSEIRPILTALGTTSSSERRIKDSGEIIYDLVKAMSRESSFLPKFKITQHMESRSIETPDSKGPLRISPSTHSFIEGMINSLGYHPNVAPDAGDPIASTTQIIGPPPLDLFVSVNRRNLDPIRVDEAYRLPIEATTERGPSAYTLQGFAYWTGGHYISFYKNLDRTWTMVNDSVASTPSLDILTYHRERASLIYYQRNDAPSLDTDEDNAWWRDPAPVVGTGGAGGECSLM